MTDLLPSASELTHDTDGESLGSDRTKGGQRTRLVVDTSVLIADPTCVLEFTDADVIIRLDRRRGTRRSQLASRRRRARAARTALRTIEELRIKHGGSLATPGPTGNGSATIQIEINNIRKHLLVEHGLDPTVPDNHIIGARSGSRTSARPR